MQSELNNIRKKIVCLTAEYLAKFDRWDSLVTMQTETMILTDTLYDTLQIDRK